MQRQAILRLQRDRRRDDFPPLLPLDVLPDGLEEPDDPDEDEFDDYDDGDYLPEPEAPAGQLPILLPVGMTPPKRRDDPEPPSGLWETERLTTEAVLEEEEGRISVSFKLAGVSGLADCVLTFTESEPTLVVFDIRGVLPFSFVFEEGRTHPGEEPTPEGPMNCLVRTEKLRNGITAEGGELFVSYTRIGYFFPCTCRLRVRVETL